MVVQHDRLVSARGLTLQSPTDLGVYSGKTLKLIRLQAQDFQNATSALAQTFTANSETCCTSTDVAACKSAADATCFKGDFGFSVDRVSWLQRAAPDALETVVCSIQRRWHGDCTTGGRRMSLHTR